jgi:hypothetical protein
LGPPLVPGVCSVFLGPRFPSRAFYYSGSRAPRSYVQALVAACHANAIVPRHWRRAWRNRMRHSPLLVLDWFWHPFAGHGIPDLTMLGLSVARAVRVGADHVSTYPDPLIGRPLPFALSSKLALCVFGSSENRTHPAARRSYSSRSFCDGDHCWFIFLLMLKVSLISPGQ